MNRTIKRLALPLGAAVVLATSGFAYMATNTITTSHVGEGSGVISGYTVTPGTYSFSYGGGPGAQRVTGVTFSLNNAASQVDAFVTDAAGGNQTEYRTCVGSDGGYAWSCTITPSSNQPGTPVQNAQRLIVTAAQ